LALLVKMREGKLPENTIARPERLSFVKSTTIAGGIAIQWHTIPQTVEIV